MSFVVDASVAICWFLREQASNESVALLRRAKTQGMVIPAFWHIEVANQLGRKLRFGALSPEELSVAFSLIEELDPATDAMAWQTAAEIVPFMNQYQLTAYDASYLQLAIWRKLPLATFDKELIRAARQAEVAVL